MIDRIINKIQEISSVKSFCMAAIDGCGGSGKSTLAQYIASKCGGAQIVHIDDFYKPSNKRVESKLYSQEVAADYDIKRLIEQVIDPIIAGRESRYQRYDWPIDDLAEWHRVKPEGLIIIEGVYSLSDELYSKCNIKIFVECSRELRLKRGLERDGEDAIEAWERWMSGEDKYLNEQKPQNRADFIISGEEKYLYKN
jgi:uridine kinase